MIKNLRMGEVHIIESGNSFGNMNTNKAFYPEGMSLEERQQIFLERRLNLGRAYGFDGHKMFMADQKDKTGTWFEIDRDYVDAHPKGWADIPEDILIISRDVPGVVIGHPAADCPVIMAYDRKNHFIAIGHCSADLVDKKMPMLVIDALLDSHGTRDEDIQTYISACAGKSWTYDKYPAWATDDKVWEGAITQDENGLFHIDLRQAVIRQLRERNIEDIIVSPIDTITDPGFFSNSAAKNGNKEKHGRNFSGAFFSKQKSR